MEEINQSSKSERLYLVDGSGYIYRAFYAVAPLSNSTGLPTNALFGFSRMIAKLLKDVSARHIAVAFDSKEPTFRHLKFDNYKANRAECPPELVLQMPYFRDLTKAYGISVLEQSGIEADDILATIATNYHDAPVTIVSGDKDLCQLVNEQITVWDAMRDIHYTASAVREKFGVSPEQIVDYLALIGDTSDNVPGIPGIGPKTAATLLNQFTTIDGIYQNLETIGEVKGLRGAARVIELLTANKEQLALSQWLVTLLKDVEEFRSPNREQLTWHGPDQSLLQEILSKLEFRSPLLISSPSTSVKEIAEAPALKAKEKKERKEKQSTGARQEDLFAKAVESKAAPVIRDYLLVTKDNFSALIKSLEQANSFAFDLETSSLDRLSTRIVGFSFAIRNAEGTVEGFYLPVRFRPEDQTFLELKEIRFQLKNLFVAEKLKIGSNLKFDLAVLISSGFFVQGPFGDTMLLSYVINPDIRQHGLKDLARKILHEEMVSYETMLKGKSSIDEVPIQELGSYASHDAEAALKIHEELLKVLLPSQAKLYNDIEIPMISVLEEIERAGIKVDAKILKEMSDQFQVEIISLEKELYLLAGREINLNSPKQLSGLLFSELGLPVAGIKKTTHGYSTDAAALERLSRVHPLPAKLLEYRELFKLKSTYLDALPKLIREDTGRIHTSFNQAVAATGRLSSPEPNLQNIPIRNEKGRRIRTAFIAEENFQLICADYSQVELRILAHLSEDAELTQSFLKGLDIHTRTAELIFPGRFSSADDQEKKELRRYAKTINFGVIYGMGAFRLADELSLSRAEAGEFINQYFNTYSGVRAYFDNLEESAKSLGYVETVFGRRRYLKDIDSSGRDFNYAVRSLLNAPLQGTAADIMKIAMINLSQSLKPYGIRARVVLQVHDELIVECHKDISEEIRSLVVARMSTAVKLNIPLEVDARIVSNWR